ncbi:hypothetical protein BU26DRAFT_558281 [Trematosphaeria pertusa]|uniref:Uncharacterized protein n=1 Tax=Trematosphaeria pertusa TaxID=390896 RepID=A0A6A6J5T4_9PLEO|nr:uncharacterized protein BU26DRAFT_558281 [Trematosphaeria pertusa]KAF2256843.1 hypothetical protein BU26DRAFT_558281 [Trematosphaeria pertusa]
MPLRGRLFSKTSHTRSASTPARPLDPGDYAFHEEVRRRQIAEWEERLIGYRREGGQIEPTGPDPCLTGESRLLEAPPAQPGPPPSTPLPPLLYPSAANRPAVESLSMYPQNTHVQRATRSQTRLTQLNASYAQTNLVNPLPKQSMIPRKPVPPPKDRPATAAPRIRPSTGVPEHSELWFDDQLAHFRRNPSSPPVTPGPSNWLGERVPPRSAPFQTHQGSSGNVLVRPSSVQPIRPARPPRLNTALLGFRSNVADFRQMLPPEMQPPDKPLPALPSPVPQLPSLEFDTDGSLHEDKDLSKYLTADKSGLEPFKRRMPTSTAIVKGDIKKIVGTE